MKQRIFSHFQDYLIQYISHQYQDLLYCNTSQYILSTYNSQHNNNNNVVSSIESISDNFAKSDTWAAILLIRDCACAIFTLIN